LPKKRVNIGKNNTKAPEKEESKKQKRKRKSKKQKRKEVKAVKKVIFCPK